MPDEFTHDVFLSHSSKDKAIVRDVAERLKKDGIKVWFDEWEIRPGDSIPSKIEEGLERSRVLVLCMSANAFGSDWAQLEYATFRFRDPLNKERRFIPMRIDDAPIKGSLAQFLYINWQPANREQEYGKLREACLNPLSWPSKRTDDDRVTDARHLLVKWVSKQRSEWKRLQTDFEAEARKYHELGLLIFYIDKNTPWPTKSFPDSNHAINLWQYYGATPTKETVIDLVKNQKFTQFGVTGAQLSFFGVVFGDQTKLFCKMATRAGSLLPSDVNRKVIEEISDRLADDLNLMQLSGKPLWITNPAPLAQWINLVVLATMSLHPDRFIHGSLKVDPFAGSLAIFDYLKMGE